MTKAGRYLSLLLAFALCLCAISPVSATRAETLDITYAPILYDGFVADTLDGVDAIYNSSYPSPNCGEYVERYYRQVYGLQVITGGEPYVAGSSQYWFEPTNTPQKGDILYASGAVRDIMHYAICKEADLDAGTVTLIEQNWIWDGKAGVNRKIAIGDVYTAYTLRWAEGTEAPIANTQPQNEPASPQISDVSATSSVQTSKPFGAGAPSVWAQDTILRAEGLELVPRYEGTYQKPILRGDYAALVVHAAKSLLGYETSSDNVLQQAKELNLMGGDGKGNFHENEPLTRQEAAVVMERMLGLRYISKTADRSYLNRYADRKSIADWAADAVSVMTQTGIMGGTGTGFSPNSLLTQEQAIAILIRIYDYA